MKANLDKWIKDAKDEVPESGEYRRLNRAMLKERMANMAPRRRRRHRVLLAVLSLVFLMLFSGQLNQSGSDGFDMKTSISPLPLTGDTAIVYKNEFRSGSSILPQNFSKADVIEYHQSVAAGEGEMIKVLGTSYGGKTNWTKLVRRIINGQERLVGDIVHDPKPDPPRDLDEFLKANILDFNVRIKSEPPHGMIQMVVDGVLVDFKFWTFEYPGYGEVTKYIGVPVEKN